MAVHIFTVGKYPNVNLISHVIKILIRMLLIFNFMQGLVFKAAPLRDYYRQNGRDVFWH